MILSNGSKEVPTTDYIATLKDDLFALDGSLTFEVAHENEDWDRLIGRTNSQGRLINASTDVCALNATINSGRFIHMEQEKSKLRDTEAGWALVASAVETSFSAVLPVELESFDATTLEGNSTLLSWSTVSEVDNDHFQVLRSVDGKDWEVIATVEGKGNSVVRRHYQYVDKAPVWGINYYRLKQIDFDGRSTLLPSRMVNHKIPDLLNMSVYPNPVSELLHIANNGVAISQVNLFSLVGSDLSGSITSLVKTEQGYTISLENLKEGVYQLLINEKQVLKVIKRD